MDTKTKTIKERAQDFYNAMFDDERLELMQVADGEKKPSKKLKENYSYSDWTYPDEAAREILEQEAYGIDKETIYYITLAGGGPAARIRVEVEDGEVIGASLQFCDWFEKWTDAPNQDSELVERYASLVGYYGE